MALEEYRRKRDFGKTPEPAGEAAADRGGPLEFVIQKHDASRLHYDFRLELDGVLKSWAVPKGPSLDPSVKRLAMHVEDHPLEYGDFEGIIPEGEYGGGTVLLWDQGVWKPVGDPAATYRKGRLKFILEGEKLRGAWTLVQMRGRDEDDGKSWLLIKERDAEARPESEYDIAEERPESVVTGRGLDDIAADRDRVWHSNREDGGSATGRKGGAGRKSSGSRGRAGARSRKAGGVESLPGARKAARPKSAEPQLARLVTDVPAGDDWLHEIKFDGYRVLIHIDGGSVRVITRNGKDWTERFPGIAEAAASLPCARAVVDGEAVVLDEQGVSSFQALQGALGRKRGAAEIVCYAFDLLFLDGYDLTVVPLVERKAALAALLDGGERIRYSDHVLGNGPAFFAQACGLHLEGVISKRAAGPHRDGRSSDWLKIKCLRRQEFVVVGYTDPGGSRTGFGALILGVHDDEGRLVGAGRAGTGFTDKQLRQLHAMLVPLERETAPIENPPSGAEVRGIHWVEPKLVAEVAFTEWTDEGVIRHPSFQGLREDRPVESIVREEPQPLGTALDADAAEDDAPTPRGRTPKASTAKSKATQDGGGEPRRGGRASSARSRATSSAGRAARTSPDRPRAANRRGARSSAPSFAGVKLSKPDKVLYPDDGITKLDIASYWDSVLEHAMPHLKDRPLTLVRCPSGIAAERGSAKPKGGRAGDCFFQKHAGEGTPDVVARVQVEPEPDAEPYAMIDAPAALFALVQLGVLEFHVWGSRADKLDRPDRLIFDLDPDEDLAWKEVVEAAGLVRDLLASFELTSFVKTTGGKGLHIMLPLERRADWADVKEFARVISEGFANAYPKKYTAKMTKSRRSGRIYIDYLRNGWNATAIAAFSTRARPGAPVSVPISWEELASDRNRPVFTIRDVPDRLASMGEDPWAGFDEVRQSLSPSVLKQVGLG